MNQQRFGLLHAVMLLLCISSTSAVLADDDHSLLDDARLYVTAPVRWDQRDWLYAGGAIAAIVASHHYDSQVRAHFATTTTSDVKDKYSTQDALPAVAALAGTWALSWWWDDNAGYREGRNMVEAGVFSAATVFVLKQVVHRERPNVTADSSSWKLGDSFPSLHASFAGAIGAVLAESGSDDYRWARRTLGYGLVAGSAYIRLRHNQHWLSDTVAGATLGMTTARFVMNRNRPYESSSLMVVPLDKGLLLSYSASFH
jgi:hypothetical protein